MPQGSTARGPLQPLRRASTSLSGHSFSGAERYDGTLEDVFALQDRVALNIVGVIVPTVQNAEIRRASSRPTRNMGCYDLFMRALALVGAYEKADS